LLTAILASIITSARWQNFAINYNTDSYELIFSKFLPLIIIAAVMGSVIVFTSRLILKKDK
jgi:hypothetical protein